MSMESAGQVSCVAGRLWLSLSFAVLARKASLESALEMQQEGFVESTSIFVFCVSLLDGPKHDMPALLWPIDASTKELSSL